MNTQTSRFREKPHRSGRTAVLAFATRVFSPFGVLIAGAQCQVHSRCFVRIYWTRPQTQSRGRACPLKCRGLGRKGCSAPGRRTRAPGYISPREAREATLRERPQGTTAVMGSRCRGPLTGVSISCRCSQPSPVSNQLIQEN